MNKQQAEQVLRQLIDQLKLTKKEYDVFDKALVTLMQPHLGTVGKVEKTDSQKK